jgi:hypothetical protein
LLASIDGKKEEEEEDKDVSDMNPTQRIHHLERSIGFLKQQHQEVLRCLHEEISYIFFVIFVLHRKQI